MGTPITENAPKCDILKRSFISLALRLLPGVSLAFSAVLLGPYLLYYKTETDKFYLKGWEEIVDGLVWVLSGLSTVLPVYTLYNLATSLRDIAQHPQGNDLKRVDDM